MVKDTNMTNIAEKALILLARKRLMNWAFTTCVAMCGSGAKTGTKVHKINELFVEAAGTTLQGFAVYLPEPSPLRATEIAI